METLWKLWNKYQILIEKKCKHEVEYHQGSHHLVTEDKLYKRGFKCDTCFIDFPSNVLVAHCTLCKEDFCKKCSVIFQLDKFFMISFYVFINRIKY